MDPFFTAVNYPLPEHRGMLMSLQDFQVAEQGNDYFTWMGMAMYGLTPRWSVGAMIEGQKIFRKPVTFGGARLNTWFQLFPEDRLLHFSLYGEYEGLNKAALYKMEISGFGSGDLIGSLKAARNTAAQTLETRAIVYHDWGRLNVTFNFISETDLQNGQNDFGYALGVFWQAAWTGMEMGSGMSMGETGMGGMPMGGGIRLPQMPPKKMEGMANAPAPPLFSLERLGWGVELVGGLGNVDHFGVNWNRQQHYLGPVLNYALSPRWRVRIEPAVGLSAVSDPFVLRTAVDFMF